MDAIRRKATAAQIRGDRQSLDIADAMIAPFHPSSFVVDDNDPLDDSLEDIWPGLAAETAARRAAGISAFAPTPGSLPVVAFPAPQKATPKAKAPRTVKAKAPRAPRKSAAKAKTPAPVEAPVAPVVVPVRPVVTRAPLGLRRQAPAPLPSAAKTPVEGSQIPAEVRGVVKITGSFKASTGDTLVVEIEGQNHIARGIVVWAGPLQDRVRKASAQGEVVRFAIRQPSNPRFKPAISAMMAA